MCFLLDMAIHTFDAARYMVNGEPLGAYCQEWEPPNSWFRQDRRQAPPSSSRRQGVSLPRRWCADGFRTSWEGAWRIVS